MNRIFESFHFHVFVLSWQKILRCCNGSKQIGFGVCWGFWAVIFHFLTQYFGRTPCAPTIRSIVIAYFSRHVQPIIAIAILKHFTLFHFSASANSICPSTTKDTACTNTFKFNFVLCFVDKDGQIYFWWNSMFVV